MEKKTLIIENISDINKNLSIINSLESNNINIKGTIIDKIQKQVRKEMSEYFTIEKIQIYTKYIAPGKCLGIQGNFNNQNIETFLMDKFNVYYFNYNIQIQFSFEELKNKKLRFRFILMNEKDKQEEYFEKEFREIDFEKIINEIQLKFIENGICENISIEESNVNYTFSLSTRSLIIYVENIENNFEGYNHISMLFNDF